VTRSRSSDPAAAFERAIAAGGLVVFPADTVYGIACSPDDRFAVQRLYLLKRRQLSKPSAVMFFGIDAAFAALPELGDRTRDALSRLLPGGVTARAGFRSRVAKIPRRSGCAYRICRCWRQCGRR